MRQPFSKKKFHSLCSSSLSELRRYWKHFPRSPLVFPRCWQLSQTPRKRQPLSSFFFFFFSLPSPAPFQGERRAFDESPLCSRRVPNRVSSSSSSVSDGSDRGDTCPEPPLTERERKEERGGGREAHCLMGETHSEATNLQRLSLIVTGQEVPCY